MGLKAAGKAVSGRKGNREELYKMSARRARMQLCLIEYLIL